MAKQVIAADEARRVAQAANLSDAPLRALADSSTPVPVPENAEEVKFDGADGRLEFNSSSSVRTVAAFYRSSLTSQGWKEKPSIINQPNMAVMEFSRGGKSVSLTAMQMGPKVKVSADGSGLVIANARTAAKSGAANAKDNNEPAGKAVDEPLEAEADSRFAGTEAAHHAHDRNRKDARQRCAVPQGARGQCSCRAQFGAGVLPQRTRQARLAGDG